MNPFTKKIFLGAALLTLSACAHYQQPAYHSYAEPYPAYSSNSYVIKQSSYYGGYPYRYNHNSNSVYGKAGYDYSNRDGYKEHQHHDNHKNVNYRTHPWNKGAPKSNQPHGHRHHPANRKNEPLVINDRIIKYPSRNHQGSIGFNDIQGKLHLADRKQGQIKPDRSGHDHQKNKQNRRHYDRKD